MRAKYYREGHRRDPEEITDIMGAIIERVGSGADRSAATLVQEWDEIVPERWRGDAEPIGIRDGVLLVEVPSGAVASVLRHDTLALLKRISDRFEPDLVEVVKVRVSRVPKNSKTR